MSELLQFMYQGVVNVKHADLSSFMKIAQALHIKGLATSTAQKPLSSPIQSSSNTNLQNSKNLSAGGAGGGGTNSENYQSNNVIETKINSALFSNKNIDNQPTTSTPISSSQKRPVDYSGEALSIYSSKKQVRRSSDSGDNDMANESMGTMSSDEVFLPPIPQISMSETRFDLNNVKRESSEPLLSPGAMRNLVPPPFNFEYNNSVYNKNIEYPNDLHANSEYSKSIGTNHMDIPAGILLLNIFAAIF